MSFKEQERALFDLLFDRPLRENFCQDSTSLLAAYELNGAELNDFREIRSDAIELDASMRTYQILTHICRQFPITFSLASSHIYAERTNQSTDHALSSDRTCHRVWYTTSATNAYL